MKKYEFDWEKITYGDVLDLISEQMSGNGLMIFVKAATLIQRAGYDLDKVPVTQASLLTQQFYDGLIEYFLLPGQKILNQLGESDETHIWK